MQGSAVPALVLKLMQDVQIRTWKAWPARADGWLARLGDEEVHRHSWKTPSITQPTTNAPPRNPVLSTPERAGAASEIPGHGGSEREAG